MPPFHALQLPVGPIQTNCYIVADESTGDAVIIDPGADAQQLLDALVEQKWMCQHILLTHAHFDHIGAVKELVEATSAPVAIHPKELALLHARGGAQAFGVDLEPLPMPDVLLVPGEPLVIGPLHFEVLFVPGHTAGHVAFYHRQGKAVFSGDVLFQQGIGRTDLPGGNYDQLMRSLREVLLQLPDDTVVCPGHGPTTTIGAERRENPFLQD